MDNRTEPASTLVPKLPKPAGGLVDNRTEPASTLVPNLPKPTGGLVDNRTEPPSTLVPKHSKSAGGLVDDRTEPASTLVPNLPKPAGGLVDDRTEPASTLVPKLPKPVGGLVDNRTEPASALTAKHPEPAGGLVDSRTEPASTLVPNLPKPAGGLVDDNGFMVVNRARLCEPDETVRSRPCPLPKDAHRVSSIDAHRVSSVDAHRVSSVDTHRVSSVDAHRVSSIDVQRDAPCPLPPVASRTTSLIGGKHDLNAERHTQCVGPRDVSGMHSSRKAGGNSRVARSHSVQTSTPSVFNRGGASEVQQRPAVEPDNAAWTGAQRHVQALPDRPWTPSARSHGHQLGRSESVRVMPSRDVSMRRPLPPLPASTQDQKLVSKTFSNPVLENRMDERPPAPPPALAMSQPQTNVRERRRLLPDRRPHALPAETAGNSRVQLPPKPVLDRSVQELAAPLLKGRRDAAPLPSKEQPYLTRSDSGQLDITGETPTADVSSDNCGADLARTRQESSSTRQSSAQSRLTRSDSGRLVTVDDLSRVSSGEAVPGCVDKVAPPKISPASPDRGRKEARRPRGRPQLTRSDSGRIIVAEESLQLSDEDTFESFDANFESAQSSLSMPESKPRSSSSPGKGKLIRSDSGQLAAKESAAPSNEHASDSERKPHSETEQAAGSVSQSLLGRAQLARSDSGRLIVREESTAVSSDEDEPGPVDKVAPPTTIPASPNHGRKDARRPRGRPQLVRSDSGRIIVAEESLQSSDEDAFESFDADFESALSPLPTPESKPHSPSSPGKGKLTRSDSGRLIVDEEIAALPGHNVSKSDTKPRSATEPPARPVSRSSSGRVQLTRSDSGRLIVAEELPADARQEEFGGFDETFAESVRKPGNESPVPAHGRSMSTKPSGTAQLTRSNSGRLVVKAGSTISSSEDEPGCVDKVAPSPTSPVSLNRGRKDGRRPRGRPQLTRSDSGRIIVAEESLQSSDEDAFESFDADFESRSSSSSMPESKSRSASSPSKGKLIRSDSGRLIVEEEIAALPGHNVSKSDTKPRSATEPPARPVSRSSSGRVQLTRSDSGRLIVAEELPADAGQDNFGGFDETFEQSVRKPGNESPAPACGRSTSTKPSGKVQLTRSDSGRLVLVEESTTVADQDAFGDFDETFEKPSKTSEKKLSAAPERKPRSATQPSTGSAVSEKPPGRVQLTRSDSGRLVIVGESATVSDKDTFGDFDETFDPPSKPSEKKYSAERKPRSATQPSSGSAESGKPRGRVQLTRSDSGRLVVMEESRDVCEQDTFGDFDETFKQPSEEKPRIADPVRKPRSATQPTTGSQQSGKPPGRPQLTRSDSGRLIMVEECATVSDKDTFGDFDETFDRSSKSSQKKSSAARERKPRSATQLSTGPAVSEMPSGKVQLTRSDSGRLVLVEESATVSDPNTFGDFDETFDQPSKPSEKKSSADPERKPRSLTQPHARSRARPRSFVVPSAQSSSPLISPCVSPHRSRSSSPNSSPGTSYVAESSEVSGHERRSHSPESRPPHKPPRSPTLGRKPMKTPAPTPKENQAPPTGCEMSVLDAMVQARASSPSPIGDRSISPSPELSVLDAMMLAKARK